MDNKALALWQALAYEIIRRLAATIAAFSSDDIWAALEHLAEPDDPRALGPILTRAAKDGHISKSDFVVKSQRRACHGRPIHVWLSCVRGASDLDASAYVASKKATLTAATCFIHTPANVGN